MRPEPQGQKTFSSKLEKVLTQFALVVVSQKVFALTKKLCAY